MYYVPSVEYVRVRKHSYFYGASSPECFQDAFSYFHALRLINHQRKIIIFVNKFIYSKNISQPRRSSFDIASIVNV